MLEPQRQLFLATFKGLDRADRQVRLSQLRRLEAQLVQHSHRIRRDLLGPYLHKDVGATRAFIGFAKPGSPWIDLFQWVTDPQSARDVVVKLFATYFPEDAALVAQIEPLHEDPHSWFLGAVTPTVRRAAAATASGRPVAAIGDAAVSFDPIGGQGAQNAVIQSARLIRALRAYEGEITYEWLRDRFDSHWDYRVEAAAEVTRLFLGDPKYAAHGELLFPAAARSTGALQARSSAFSPSRNPCSTSGVRGRPSSFRMWRAGGERLGEVQSAAALCARPNRLRPRSSRRSCAATAPASDG